MIDIQKVIYIHVCDTNTVTWFVLLEAAYKWTQEGEVHQSCGLEKGSWRREYPGGWSSTEILWQQRENWDDKRHNEKLVPWQGLKAQRLPGFRPGPAGPLPTTVAWGSGRPSSASRPHQHETHQSCCEPRKPRKFINLSSLPSIPSCSNSRSKWRHLHAQDLQEVPGKKGASQNFSYRP